MTDEKQPRVIDGEAVAASDTDTAQNTSKEDKKASKPAAQARSPQADWLARLLAVAALGGVAWLVGNQPALTPLIEAQNAMNARLQALEETVRQMPDPDKQIKALQQELSELKETVEALSTEVDALNEKVLNPANEPLVTKGELERLQKQLQGLQGQLQAFAQRWQEALKGVQMPAPQQNEEAKPTPPALSQLQQQLTKMGQQLSQLFGQMASPEQAEVRAHAQVDPMTLQRWLLKVNAEWLLTGDVRQTRQRLHALEKAVQLSELPPDSKIALLRAIGQDLVYLDQYAQAAKGDAKLLDELRDWIRHLPPPEPNKTHSAPAGSTALMDRLKGLVEIRKRDEGLSAPERLMAFDLVRQRALVLVDQLAWAYASHHVDLFDQTKARLIQLFEQALPHAVADLKKRLAALPEPVVPQPLKSAEAL